jgi:hypothetical protein
MIVFRLLELVKKVSRDCCIVMMVGIRTEAAGICLVFTISVITMFGSLLIYLFFSI